MAHEIEIYVGRRVHVGLEEERNRLTGGLFLIIERRRRQPRRGIISFILWESSGKRKRG
jgi:hypothetical protein